MATSPSDLTELFARFGPIDLRSGGGQVSYYWPEERTRGRTLTGWSVQILPRGDWGRQPDTGWSRAFHTRVWFNGNTIARLLAGDRIVAATPLVAMPANGRPAELVTSHTCRDGEPLRTELEIAAPLPADVWATVTFDFTLFARTL